MSIARSEGADQPAVERHVAAAQERLERIPPASGQLDERQQGIVGCERDGPARRRRCEIMRRYEGICALEGILATDSITDRENGQRARKEPCRKCSRGQANHEQSYGGTLHPEWEEGRTSATMRSRGTGASVGPPSSNNAGQAIKPAGADVEWRRGDSNPGPRLDRPQHLRAYLVVQGLRELADKPPIPGQAF